MSKGGQSATVVPIVVGAYQRQGTGGPPLFSLSFIMDPPLALAKWCGYSSWGPTHPQNKSYTQHTTTDNS